MDKLLVFLRICPKTLPITAYVPGDSKWPFDSLVGGYQQPFKWSLDHPKKVTKNRQVHTFAMSSYQLVYHRIFFNNSYQRNSNENPMNFPRKLRNGLIYLMITGRNQWVHHRICIARTIPEVDFVRVGRRAQDWMCVCVLVEYSGFGIGCRDVWCTLTVFFW